MYSDLCLFHGCCVRVVVLALWWVQLFLVVFDPVCDAQEDAQPMQTVHVPRVRLGHSHQDLFGLGLAQDTGKRLQKHLEVTFTEEHTHHFLIRVTTEMHSVIMPFDILLSKLRCSNCCQSK